AYAGLGRSDLAVAHLNEARRIAEETGNADELCRAYGNLATVLQTLGRSTEAIDVALDGWRLAGRLGLSRFHGSHMLNTAVESLTWLGRWDEADGLLD